MENPETPKRRSWAVVRKAQVIGAVTGALLAVGARILLYVCGLVGIADDGAVAATLFGFFLLALWPEYQVERMLGLPKINHPLGEILVTAVNTVLFYLAGTIVGWLVVVLRHLKKRRPLSQD
jgi:predicted DNA repair protein MutK